MLERRPSPGSPAETGRILGLDEDPVGAGSVKVLEGPRDGAPHNRQVLDTDPERPLGGDSEVLERGEVAVEEHADGEVDEQGSVPAEVAEGGNGEVGEGGEGGASDRRGEVAGERVEPL